MDYIQAYPGIASPSGEPLDQIGDALLESFRLGIQPAPPPPSTNPDPITIEPGQRLDAQIAYHTAIGHIVTGDEEALPPLAPADPDQPSSSGSTWIPETTAEPMQSPQSYEYHVDASGRPSDPGYRPARGHRVPGRDAGSPLWALALMPFVAKGHFHNRD
jgi:hypothetical protein